MGQSLSCPRCQAKVESAGYAPGSSLRCPECGGLMRVPSGRTGIHAAVQAAPPGPSTKVPTRLRVKAVGGEPEADRGSGTRMRVKAVGSGSETRMRAVTQARRKKSNAGMIVGLLVGGVFVAVVLFLVLMQPGKSSDVASGPGPRPASPRPMAPPPAAPAPAPSPAPAPADSSGPVPAPPPSRADDPAKANWDQLMQALRPGGGFDDLSRPEGAAFAKVKRMGKAAYAYLTRFIDNEDVVLGKAAVVVLNELTGRKSVLPNEATKAKVKTEWETWIRENP